MPVAQTIRCPLCQHQFDTAYQKHCLCKACRASISVPDARANYVRSISTQIATSIPVRRALPSDGLPPVVRDDQGRPMKPAAPPASPEPVVKTKVAEEFSFMARRLKQIEAEKTERINRQDDKEAF